MGSGLTTVFCIGDTENSRRELRFFSNKLKSLMYKADVLLHLGDGVDEFKDVFGNQPCRKSILIRGNHDHYYNKSLLRSKVIEINGLNCFVYHGISFNQIWENFDVLFNKIKQMFGKAPDLSWYYSDQRRHLAGKYDLVVSGHTHIPRIKKIGRTIFFCPGGFTHKNSVKKTNLSVGVVVIKKSCNQTTIRTKVISFIRDGMRANTKLVMSKGYVVK